jgi:uncharacterized protein DUF5916/cellulose/xylan binding protein with CBM9 domain
VLLLIGVLCGLAYAGSSPQNAPPSTLIIPRLARAPTLEEFLTMHPEGEVATGMVKVTGFVQRNPHDRQPASQPTEAYLGYDQKNLYVVFVCFDDPSKVRARMSRREDIFSDDNVEIMLDTFHDRRRAYAFQTNPLGVQWDAIWTEIPHEDSNGNLSNFDSSFDTVWSSRGKLTQQGYVVWMAIPFKSLRFSPQEQQSWGLILYRGILRENEDDFWPEISRRVEGRLGQAATANGLEKISPGRNMQFIPYGALRSFHAPDANKSAEFRGGLDSKFILHDNLVLDVTANPDFSQVESDEPQITVNQRFAVYFPEKRPFFLENADYFKTPMDLFFTRNIGDPQFGARLTGKVGPYSLGILSSDDRGPGDGAPAGSPLEGARAIFNIGRVSRDIFRQSSVGAIYTDWELPAANEFNRIGGLDSRLKFDPNWTGTFQGVVSSTQNQDGTYQAGPAYRGDVNYSGTNLNYEAMYNDISPGFTTDVGFVNRVDVREMKHSLSYRFRPSDGPLLSWGPDLFTDHVWAHDGTRLDTLYDPDIAIQLKGQTFIHVTPYVEFRERLRPSDFPALTQDQDFHEHNSSISFATNYLPKVAVNGYYQYGDGVNFVPPANQAPFLAKEDLAQLSVSFLPIRNLKIENLYLFDRLRDRPSGASIFNNHIVRSKWNWQFNRELSVRVILQYTATLANPVFTELTTSKDFNADFLITYLVHPGTAVYVGYNSDLQNNNGPRYVNDSRQFFVKVSYLFRF